MTDKRIRISESEQIRARRLQRFWEDTEIQQTLKDVEADILTQWQGSRELSERESLHAEWQALARLKRKFAALCAPLDVAE